MQNVFWLIFDAATGIFALVFYLFVAWLGMYAIVPVVYNVAAARRRRKEERPEPPAARPAGTVYPDGKGGDAQ